MAGTDLVTWSPPEAVALRKNTKRLLLGGAAVAAVVGFWVVGPTLRDLLMLLRDIIGLIFQNMFYAAGLVVGAILLFDIANPQGALGRSLRMWWIAQTDKLAWAVLEINPMAQIDEAVKEQRSIKQEFEHTRMELEGILETISRTAAQYRKDSASAELEAKGAKKRLDAGEDFGEAHESAVNRYGRLKEAAVKMEAKTAEIIPMRDKLSGLSKATGVLISDLELEARLMRDEWNLQETIGKATQAAHKMLSTTDKKEIAKQAGELINRRYAEKIGHLRHVSEQSKGLVQSIDLKTASYDEELAQKWHAEATQAEAEAISKKPMQMLAGAARTPVGIPIR